MPARSRKPTPLTNGGLEVDSNGLDETSSSSSTSAISALLAVAIKEGGSGAAAGDGRDVVKVNNASVTEMKHACDDALKRFLSRPELFKQIYTHTDVRLALGWACVFVAAGTGLYGYKVEFEKSKPVVWAGLILYITLTVLQTLYAYFIEGDIVFVGKRKTFDKRIVTERITISSVTSQPSSSASSSSQSTSSQLVDLPPPTNCPSYSISLSYIRSTNGGKSLLGKGKTITSRGYNTFFDSEGVLDQERFERWVGSAVGGLMEGKTV
ncbi:microsomal signal peptidase 25 kDa subunit-domain-containing protein [Abortiporus biennis]|nr:microsomal signal peptidase 25 kDa subunit-domain-containing protein [Abortiporus biennis]